MFIKNELYGLRAEIVLRRTRVDDHIIAQVSNAISIHVVLLRIEDINAIVLIVRNPVVVIIVLDHGWRRRLSGEHLETVIPAAGAPAMHQDQVRNTLLGDPFDIRQAAPPGPGTGIIVLDDHLEGSAAAGEDTQGRVIVIADTAGVGVDQVAVADERVPDSRSVGEETLGVGRRRLGRSNDHRTQGNVAVVIKLFIKIELYGVRAEIVYRLGA